MSERESDLIDHPSEEEEVADEAVEPVEPKPDDDDTADPENQNLPWITRGQAIFVAIGGIVVLLVAAAVAWRITSGGAMSPAEHFQAGWDAFVAEDDVELEKHVRFLLRKPNWKAYAEVLHAALYLREGRYRDAMTQVRRFATNIETQSAALTIAGLGMLEEKSQGSRREALDLFVKACNADRDNLVAHRNAGSIFYDLGAMDLAIRHLAEVSRLAVYDPRPNRLIGLINKDYGRYDAAVVNYQEALKRNSRFNRKEILLEMAQCQLKLKQFTETIQSIDKLRKEFIKNGKLQEAKKLSPQDRLHLVDSMVAKSDALQSLNKTAQATVEADMALQYAPNHLEALLHKSNLLVTGRKEKEALKYCQRAVDRHPKSEVARYSLAQLFAQLQDETNATKQMAEFQKLKDMRTRFVEANVQAIKEPTNADIRYELAVLAHDLDRPQLAMTWLKAVLTLRADHRAARRKMVQIQGLLDKKDPPQRTQGPLKKGDATPTPGLKGGKRPPQLLPPTLGPTNSPNKKK